MSKAWYKPQVAPKLLESFSSSSRRRIVEIWNTTCAVTKAGKTSSMACTVLINPANPELSGVSKFPYFPKGGPAPKEYPKKDSHHIMGYVTQWGGMEVGSGMLFSANVVDGMVHQLGEWRLALECRFLPAIRNNEKCPVGQAVVTGPGGSELMEHFDSIVHTVPPFYNHHHDPEHYLLDCYKHSLSLSFQQGSRVACPLLGAGCRGFPLHEAVAIAGKGSIQWRDENDNNQKNNNDTNTLAFAIPDLEIAEQLIQAIQTAEENAKQV